MNLFRVVRPVIFDAVSLADKAATQILKDAYAEDFPAVCLDLAEDVSNDLSQVLGLPYALWGKTIELAGRWDLRYEQERVVRRIVHTLILIEHIADEKVTAYPLVQWQSYLPGAE